MINSATTLISQASCVEFFSSLLVVVRFAERLPVRFIPEAATISDADDVVNTVDSDNTTESRAHDTERISFLVTCRALTPFFAVVQLVLVCVESFRLVQVTVAILDFISASRLVAAGEWLRAHILGPQSTLSCLWLHSGLQHNCHSCLSTCC